MSGWISKILPSMPTKTKPDAVKPWDKNADAYGVAFFKAHPGYGKDPTLPYYVMKFWHENIDTHEIGGAKNNAFIVWLHKTFTWLGTQPDEIPWCKSSFNGACEVAGFKVGDGALAIDGLKDGVAVTLENAQKGDFIILEHRNSSGALTGGHHIGFYESQDEKYVYLLGGNQNNQIKISGFKKWEIMKNGVRRLS